MFDVKVGIPGFGDGRLRRLSRNVVIAMTLPQLQVIVNDMLTQIECMSSLLLLLLVRHHLSTVALLSGTVSDVKFLEIFWRDREIFLKYLKKNSRCFFRAVHSPV